MNQHAYLLKRVLPVIVLAIGMAAVLTNCPSCSSGLGGVANSMPVHQVTEFNGEGRVGALRMGPFTWTTPVRFWGQGTLTIQWPAKPHIAFEGDGGYLVEPESAGDAAAINAARARGEFQIVQRGQPVALAPAGSIPRSPR